MYEAYFTRRLLEALSLADEATNSQERSVHIRASRYYRELLQSQDQRASERHSVKLCAVLFLTTSCPRPVIVSDLSTQGFRVQLLDDELKPGTLVALQIDRLAALDAYVVWQQGDETGCKFLAELRPALLDAALALSPHVQ